MPHPHPEQRRKVVPIGLYPARAIAAEWGRTQAKKPQLAVTFVLLADNISPTGEFGGKQLTKYFQFSTDNAFAYSVKALRTMGWTGDDLESAAKQIVQIGATVELDVQHEDKTNPQTGEVTVYATIRWVNSLAAGPSLKDRMSEGDIKSFAAQMKGTIKSLRSQGGDYNEQEVQHVAPKTQALTPGGQAAERELDAHKTAAEELDDIFSDPSKVQRADASNASEGDIPF